MRKGIIVLTCFMLLRPFVNGCGWDWDTLQMEREQFPTVHELITGKFLRHSQAFYYWRVRDRQEKMILHPDSLELYDDLAWAYDKIGEHDRAIQTMLDKEEKAPGIYETYANLGTSYIHNGQLKEGLEYIKKAIEINPQAHFGREIYQQHLVAYVLEKVAEKGEMKLPLSMGTEPDFYTYLKEHEFAAAIENGSNREAEIAKAIKGVSGMMKFGDYESPVLLEVLGDLLYAAKSGTDPSAGHLAARAYLKASFELDNQDIASIYRNKAEQSLERKYAMHDGPIDYEHALYSVRTLEKVLKLEVQSANDWFKEIQENELSWIESGVNPDSAFAANYYTGDFSDTTHQVLGDYYGTAGTVRDADNLIDEQYWLNKQLENPHDISKVHDFNNLDDSTIAMLDSIYEQEFSVISCEDTAQIVDPNESSEETSDKEKKGETSISWLYWILALVGGGLIVFFIYRTVNRKS